jgi:nucleotide-binding universal stress UspA family protein
VTTIKKVLCAIDLTKASRNAFDRALSIARASKARLYILHAVPANYPFSWHQSERLKLLTSMREKAEREGVPVRIVEQHGDPARTIVLHANARKADLVVLGSNRRRGWQHRCRQFVLASSVTQDAALEPRSPIEVGNKRECRCRRGGQLHYERPYCPR